MFQIIITVLNLASEVPNRDYIISCLTQEINKFSWRTSSSLSVESFQFKQCNSNKALVALGYPRGGHDKV